MTAACAEAVAPGSTGARPRAGTVALPLLLVLGLAVLSPASAAADGDDDPAALALLRRAVTAASTVAYQGARLDVAWTASGMTTRTSDVRQAAGQRRTTLRAAGDGPTTTTTEPVLAGAGTVDPLSLLTGAYAVMTAGADRIVGRQADVVVVLRGGRVAARLWLDHATGLLLREEVRDVTGRVTRMMTFVQLQVTGVSSLPGTVAGRPGESPRAAADRLGSPCPTHLPGGFELVDIRQEPVGADGGAPVLHLTYSDGLSGLSVFVQQGRLPIGGPPGTEGQNWDGARVYVAPGWPTRAVWQGGGRVFTVVSDAPEEEVEAAVGDVPGAGTSSGGLERVNAVVRLMGALLPGR